MTDIQKFGPDFSLRVATRLGNLYRDVYRDDPEADAFHSRTQFMERLEGYVYSDKLILLTMDDEKGLAGYIFGYTLEYDNWWDGALNDLPPEYTDESSGTRTFALVELVVRTDRQGQGLATALHARLLSELKQEKRVTVFVGTENYRAIALYKKLGYEKIGESQPVPTAPLSDSMTKILDPAEIALPVPYAESSR